MKNFFHPHMPALSENKALRYFSFSALYFAQGIPDGILYFGFPAWMAMNGKTPAEIGAFVGVLIIPWSFKFVMGPFIDRYTYLPMGRRRPWVLFEQIGILLSLISMSIIIDPLNHISEMMIAGFILSFFSAIGLLSMAMKFCWKKVSATQFTVYMAITILGFAVGPKLNGPIREAYVWEITILAFAVIVCVVLLFLQFMKTKVYTRQLKEIDFADHMLEEKIQMVK